MFSEIIPSDYYTQYFNNIHQYDQIFTKIIKFNIEKLFKQDISGCVENKKSLFLSYVEDLVKKENLNMTMEFNKAIEQEKTHMTKTLETNRKSIKNEINQLKDNFNKKCVDNVVDFFGDEFMMKKIKYDLLKKRNLMMEKELRYISDDMENMKLKLEKTEKNMKEMEDRFNIKLNNELEGICDKVKEKIGDSNFEDKKKKYT